MNNLPSITNLLSTPPGDREEIYPLLETAAGNLEHIVSNGQASEPGFWYDQDRPEWVLLLDGTAELTFESGESLQLEKGDSLTIPAHLRHRVESVSKDALWLALHFEDREGDRWHRPPDCVGLG